MGIMSRAMRLCKADLHGVMDQLEDKDLLLKQHLREMEAIIAGRQARIDRLEETAGTARRNLASCDKQARSLEGDLDQAVARGKEDIARMLIRKLHPLRLSITRLKEQIEHLEAASSGEQENLSLQKLKYDEIRLKVAAARAKDRHAGGMPEMLSSERTHRTQTPSEEEIEWELLQRKDAIGNGRMT